MIYINSDRKAVHVAVQFLLGILAQKTGFAILFAGAFLLPVSLFIYKKSKRVLIYSIILVLVFWAGWLRCMAEQTTKDRIRSALSEETAVTVSGRIVQKEIREDRVQYTLDRVYARAGEKTISCRKILLSLKTEPEQTSSYGAKKRSTKGAANFSTVGYRVGESLVAEGKPYLPESASNFGNFDQKQWYEGVGLDLYVLGDRVLDLKPSESPILTALADIRERLHAVYQHFLPEKDASLMSAMALGEKGALNPEIKELYQASGISHILAISGLHISMLGILLYRLLRRQRIPFLPAAVGGSTLVILYASMAGLSASAIRATLMFTFSLFAPALKKSYDSLTALAFAALVLTMQNPDVLFYSGFIFSFLAVISVVLFAQVWNRSMDDYLKRKREGREEDQDRKKAWLRKKLIRFRHTLISGAAIQFVTLPIVMEFYYEIPLYGLLLNLLLLPFAGAILIFGFLGGALGILNLYAGLLPEWPARLFLLIPKLIYTIYEKACRWAESLPFSQMVTGKPEVWIIVLYFLMLSALFLYLSSRRKPFLGFLALPALLLLGFSKRPRSFELSMLDVGQGDGIYLSSENGLCAFVDGGSTSEEEVGKNRIFPFLRASGVNHVDYWLVSHTDLDHISALKEALSGAFPVDTLVFSSRIYRDPVLTELMELAGRAGTKVVFLSPGGAVRMGKTSVKNLFPTENYNKEDKNQMSMILLVEQGDFRALLTGDTSAEEEEMMVREFDLPEIDFYKAAHHGSKYSNSMEYLSALSPEAAGISCGKNNRYGHPGAEALSNMESVGAVIYDTRFDGQIRVTLKNGEMVVESYRQ